MFIGVVVLRCVVKVVRVMCGVDAAPIFHLSEMLRVLWLSSLFDASFRGLGV